MLTTRGLGVVLADLSKMGFDAKWGVVSAADIGANHQRERIWIRAEQRNFFSHTQHNWNGRRQQQSQSTQKTVEMADSDSKRCKERSVLQPDDTTKRIKWCGSKMAYTNEYGTQSEPSSKGKSSEWFNASCIGNRNWWTIEPNVGRVVDGVAARVDRLKAIGNGQIPLCAATAWELLK